MSLVTSAAGPTMSARECHWVAVLQGNGCWQELLFLQPLAPLIPCSPHPDSSGEGGRNLLMLQVPPEVLVRLLRTPSSVLRDGCTVQFVHCYLLGQIDGKNYPQFAIFSDPHELLWACASVGNDGMTANVSAPGSLFPTLSQVTQPTAEIFGLPTEAQTVQVFLSLRAFQPQEPKRLPTVDCSGSHM